MSASDVVANIKPTRRYYLHQKLKPYVKINSKTKDISVGSTFLYSQATETQKKYLNELCNFGYNIQLFID